MRNKALSNNILLITLLALITSCSSVVQTSRVSDAPTPAITPLHQVKYSNVTLNEDPSLTIDNSMLASTSQTQDDGSLWNSLRGDFRMDHDSSNPAVQEEIQWYQNHQKRLYEALDNSAPYLYYIYQQVRARNLPGEYVLLPIIESAYDPFATSYAGASGLWQIMPETATGFGLVHNWWYDGRRDIYASSQAALNYITYLGNFFNGDWDLATAAYNSGEGTVEKAIQYNASRGQRTDFWSLPLPRQTEQYVPELLALAIIIDNPERYGITLPDIKNGPYFTAVSVDTEIDMNHIAKLADTDVTDLVQLNSGYSHDVTDPHMLNRILLPLDKLDIFKENLAAYEQDLLHHPQALAPLPNLTSSPETSQYTVHHGDTLAAIARRYHTTVLALVRTNNIHHDAIKPGQLLNIPSTTGTSSTDNSTVTDTNENTTSPKAWTANSGNSEINSTSSIMTYTIQHGDNLWTIAKKFGVTATQLRDWNNIHSDRDIRIGTVLQIQNNHKDINLSSKIIASPPKQITATPQSQKHQINSTKIYKIRSGDTLSSVAARFGISVHQLRTANNLSSNNLRIGQGLIIPAL